MIFWDPEKAKAIAEEGQRNLAELLSTPWVCKTCKGRGMVGGPSFYQPDEGGVECPDCTLKEQGEMR